MVTLPDESHTAIICGNTNCGKTKFVLDLIEGVYHDTFEKIVIICPTFNDNKTYQERAWVKEKCENVDPGSNFNIVLRKEREKNKNIKTLYIIDDCVNYSDAQKKRSILPELAMHGRHTLQSVWVLTQKYNAVVKDVRENTAWVAIFYCKDKHSLKDCLDENDVVENDKILEIKTKLKENRYAKLVIVTSHPRGWEIFP